MGLESIASDLVCSISLPPRGYYRLAVSGAGATVGTIVETSGSGMMRGGSAAFPANGMGKEETGGLGWQ